MASAKRTLIRGGQVYDHDGNVHKPPVADILIEGGNIAAVGAGLSSDGVHEVIDARDRLVVPGLINAHYHSHDTLCRGMFEELPLEMWLLYTLPMGANRSKEELRARTLVGAVESLRCGITTVQDMLGLVPLDEASTDVVVQAYREAGIRVVFSPMVWDVPPIAMVRNKDSLPPDVQDMLGTTGRPVRDQLDYLEHQFNRHPAAGALHWAVAPFAPQRCTPKMLQGCADLAHKHDLAVYTHVYETRGQALIAREQFAAHDGSLISYLEHNGLLGPRLNIVHSVWISRPEMDRMAAADAGIVLNHLSNMKLKSGIAPVCDLREAGVRLGLGCDNCSGSDVQSVFQAMKLFCLFAAVSEPEPGPALAHEVLRHATLGNARTAGLEGCLGAIKPGYKADLILIDLNDTAYLPYNSAARQLVYTESGRGVATVIVDGRVVVQDRKITTIDEDALRREVAGLMRHFIADYDAVVESRKRALPYMLDAHRQMWQPDVGMNRFIARTRGRWMSKLRLTLACWDYDRTRPLIDGRVRPEGIDLDIQVLRPRQTFQRMLDDQEFHASELSLASYVALKGRGECPFVAIPVAVSKIFRHSCFYVRAGAGIERPEDLKGKRVGTSQYSSTALVFMRGMLQHDHGVLASDMHWFMGGLNTFVEQPLIPLNLPKDIKLDFLATGKTLEGMFEAGELDALLSIYIPKLFLNRDSRIARLFPNFKEVEQAYYRRTKIFPIMHTVVVREDVHREHPWVAASLYDAFRQARDIAVEGLYDTDALRLALPFLLDHVEETWRVFGEDFWSYGLEANRPTLAAIGRYVHEQGLSPRIVEPDELFAAGLS